MTEEITVPGSYVKALLRSIEMQGLDVDEVLRSVAITREQIDVREEVPAVLLGRLHQLAMREMRDESFGMISASTVPIGSFRMMCYACIHAENLGAAIRRCGDFYEILRGSVIKPVLDDETGSAVLRFAVIDALPGQTIGSLLDAEEPIRIRAWFSMWHHFLSWLIGQRLDLTVARFTFEKPTDAGYYRKLFQSPVKFAQPLNALEFEPRYLAMPLLQTEQSLRSFLKSLPYPLIVMLDESDSMASRVSAVLGNDFSRELPSAAEVAGRLGLSVSSLRRRLLEEGTSFRAIKDECRQTAAMRYLASERMSIQDVATLTGFPEPSTFFRAFKKWTGMTPGEFRKNLV
ncbi:MAG: AraC family transcriptional regulator [Gammaproteobacteria bacterium]|nr:AraC family transcriptional regulator [Gammaproteobacteria bacterium]